MSTKRMIPVAEPEIGEEELRLVTEAVKSGWISSKGRFIAEFEENFADFCSTEYAVATSSGTTALHLALASTSIGPGDEVIVPTLSFIATANAVTYTGAKPVFVDSERDTWNIDPERIEKKITDKTKAVIPVHLFGHPADMKRILEIADEHGLQVIEDAAEAHGAKYRNRPIGSIGNAGIFSFYANKIITTGEGGMVVTDDDEIAEKARVLRDHGMSREKKYWHPVVGYNYRMTNVQAAIGVAQLKKIERFIDKKREIALTYGSFLGDSPTVTLPPEKPWAKNVYWMYSILLENGESRDRMITHLRDNCVDTRPFFYPIHEMPPYRNHTIGELPVANQLSKRGLMLPSGINLKIDEIENIAKLIDEDLGGSQ